MNTTLTNPYRQHIATPSKTRVEIFESATSSCAKVIWPQVPATHQETSGISTLLVSDVGNWLSKDPIGISGGLNQYVFCANNSINFVDPFGLDFYIIDPEGKGSAFGHMATIVGQANKYTFHTFGKNSSILHGSSFSRDYLTKSFVSLNEAMEFASDEGYTRYVKYVTSEDIDSAARKTASSWSNKRYSFLKDQICIDMIKAMLTSADIKFSVINAPTKFYEDMASGEYGGQKGRISDMKGMKY